jgi:hypothetical protein
MRPGRGYASCDRYALPDEHAAVLADEDTPAAVAGVSPVLRSLYAAEGGGSAPGRPAWGAGTSTAIRCTAAPPGN